LVGTERDRIDRDERLEHQRGDLALLLGLRGVRIELDDRGG
jgi:hypothetical protein